ncbi:ATP-binding cassette domain-containing protein [Streptomyces sp. NBC_01795]|uniref:ATP-binding cassette domain-containing protein n=1 Tax=unclassified Streptomyces TaxID=2593676 RepID=UPI002DDC762C|nr:MULTISPECIES: ATP-binding cassette domain-containing protein [unclassified Streptomyces]WSA95315.1 ATP-binding cassette domain-containing protein [Streptomyces sp. NBC_01795]WSB79734.1 ATP-binding cassette domain-containing protein [Streptomyces sp. NBC_01775]
MTQGRGAAVSAENFGLQGPRGRIFGGVTFAAGPGSLIALAGPSGSGRTCLLLSLTGRMKADEGHAKVAGHPLPKRLSAVRRVSALGPVPGVNDLDPALTVTEQLRERVLLQRRFGNPVRSLLRPRAERAAASRARLEAALEAAGLDLDALPRGGRTPVRELERPAGLRLSLALALLGEPRLLAVDDLDLKLSEEERAAAWARLRSVADAGTTVLAVCSEPPPDDLGAVVVRTEAEAPGGQGADESGGEGAGPGEDGPEGASGRDDMNGKGGAADALAEASRA